MHIKKNYIKIAFIIFLVLSIAVYYRYAHKAGDVNLVQCLAASGAKMYGANWCHNCQSQKEMFGSDFEYINYVECTEEANKQLCIDEGIEYYPTWKFPTGKVLIGRQSLEALSSAVNCR